MFKQIFTFIGFTIFTNYSIASPSSNNLSILLGGEFGTELGARIQQKQYNQINTGRANNTSKTNMVAQQGVTANNKNIGMDSFAAAYIAIENKRNPNFSYGAHIGIETTTTNSDFIGSSYLDRSYVFVQGTKLGRFELGANQGASNNMMITGGAFDAGRGTWYKYASLNTYTKESGFYTPKVQGSNFLTFQGLVIQESFSQTNHELPRKVTYYTPKFYGLQFGISYIPDTYNKPFYNRVVFPPTTGSKTATNKNAFAGGITWEHSFNKTQKINTSLVGEIGTTKQATSATATPDQKGVFHNARGIAVGAKYVHDKISLAMGYGYAGKSGFKKNIIQTGTTDFITPRNTFFVSVGGAYALSTKSSVSITYLHTKNNTNLFNLVYLGTNYKITDGIMTYAEVSRFQALQKRDYNPTTNTMTVGQRFATRGGTFITGVKIKL